MQSASTEQCSCGRTSASGLPGTGNASRFAHSRAFTLLAGQGTDAEGRDGTPCGCQERRLLTPASASNSCVVARVLLSGKQSRAHQGEPGVAATREQAVPALTREQASSHTTNGAMPGVRGVLLSSFIHRAPSARSLLAAGQTGRFRHPPSRCTDPAGWRRAALTGEHFPQWRREASNGERSCVGADVRDWQDPGSSPGCHRTAHHPGPSLQAALPASDLSTTTLRRCHPGQVNRTDEVITDAY